MPKYLQQRRRRWYATLDIPKALRPQLGGKPRFVQSLGTESLSTAEVLVLPVIARWKAHLQALKNGEVEPRPELRETALEWREAIDSAQNTTDRAAYELILADKAEAEDRKLKGTGVALFNVATREWVETAEHVEHWLSTLDNEPKTIDMKRSDLQKFCSRFSLTKKVSRKAVQQWVDHLHQTEELKLATVRRIISACRGYWSYLQRIDVVADETQPFFEVVPRVRKKTKQEIADRRQPFKETEVVALLKEALALNDTDLARLIWLGMWTGCRIEELCALKTSDIFGNHFKVADAKSEAGWREVPIHPQLVPLLSNLSKESTDGYVLSGLTRNKYKNRSNAIGKRFGRLKSRLGFGRPHVFHSIRKTVTTQLDAAGIPEAVSARILGDEIPTITYGLYSGGAPLDTKVEAMQALSYPLEAFDQGRLSDLR